MQFHFRYYKYDWNNNIYCHLWHCMGWAILDFCHQSLFLWNISISGPTLLQFCNIYCFVSEFWIFCFFISINTNSHGNTDLIWYTILSRTSFSIPHKICISRPHRIFINLSSVKCTCISGKFIGIREYVSGHGFYDGF